MSNENKTNYDFRMRQISELQQWSEHTQRLQMQTSEQQHDLNNRMISLKSVVTNEALTESEREAIEQSAKAMSEAIQTMTLIKKQLNEWELGYRRLLE